MNEQATFSTELVLPEPSNLALMFKAENGLDPLIAQLEAMARAEASAQTVATKKGRDAIISISARVSTAKATMERQGKALTEQQRKEVAAVNAASKLASERLAKLRDEIRAPVTEWEAAEAARVEKIKGRLSAIDSDRVEAFYPVDKIRAVHDEIAAMEIGADYDEYREIAVAKKALVLTRLSGYLTAAVEREAQAAELAALRRDAEARAEADRVRAEQDAAKAEAERLAIEVRRIADEKAEQLRLASERAEADRIAAAKREAERLAQVERDKLAAAEAAKVEAEQRAAKEKADAEARHQKELADAKAREEAAAQRERDRIAAQVKADSDARAKREADQAHRAKIKGDIARALTAMAGAASPEQIADALMDGKIPHCEVSL